MQDLRAIELFSGAGGLGLGISRTGFSPVDIVEFNRWCCDTIRRNRLIKDSPTSAWPEPREADIRELSFKQFEGGIDLVAGGPPCQPFSLGGKHAAQSDRRDMWSEAVRVIRETAPKAFIFENVKGLTRKAFSDYFSYICLQLSFPDIVKRQDEQWLSHKNRLSQHQSSKVQTGLNYHLYKPKILNAADFGVPQRRERVFFVGIRKDIATNWKFPSQTHSKHSLLWDQFRSRKYWDRHGLKMPSVFLNSRAMYSAKKLREQGTALPWRTVRDALQELPEPFEGGISNSSFSDHKFQPGAKIYPGHTGSPIDEPAKTLKAGVHGVPGGENMLRHLDGSVRYFTIREASKLQTFPSEYQFHGSWTEVMRQLGNAVPVDLAAIVAQSLRDALGIDTQHAERSLQSA